MRRLPALAAVLACLSLAACSDRESESKGNKGEQPEGTVQTNPSGLESTTPPETTTTQGPGG
jgi:ABC-type oligopeptide transport system substrate-binding subunit